MRFDIIWLAVFVAIAVANIAAAVANYWGVRRNRSMRSIEREVAELKLDVDALKSGSPDNRHDQRRYRGNEGEGRKSKSPKPSFEQLLIRWLRDSYIDVSDRLYRLEGIVLDLGRILGLARPDEGCRADAEREGGDGEGDDRDAS